MTLAAKAETNELEALWAQTHKHGADITSLKEMSGKLDVGQASLSRQMDREFEQIRLDIQGVTKPAPNILAIGAFCVSILVVFGSVISYMSSQTAEAMKRESDLRFFNVQTRENDSNAAMVAAIGVLAKDIDNITRNMAEDDKREQKDQYDKGYALAMFESLEKNFIHLDAELHIRHRRANDLFLNLRKDLSYLEERTENGDNQ